MVRRKGKRKVPGYRKRALKNNPYICAICGIDPDYLIKSPHFTIQQVKTHLGKNMTLQVHHKDFNNMNNDISNLEILCATCHKLIHKYKPEDREKFIHSRKKSISRFLRRFLPYEITHQPSL